ncbi:MAG: hypothetical protein ACFB0B_14615 [Thermonemataceae bacterium]
MRYFFLFIIVLVFSACEEQNPKLAQQNALEKEVMAIHDSIMPRMGQLKALKKAFKDSLAISAADSTVDNPFETTLQSNLAALDEADKAMWDWMHNYQAPDSVQIDANLIYLEEQKKLILEVKEKMESSMTNAQQTLDSLSNIR